MTLRLTFRPLAEADLEGIWDYTAARWSVAQAEQYLTGMNETLALLRAHPEIARQHPFRPPVRIFPYRSHLLIFTEDATKIEVIRVLHIRSNWRDLLTE